MSQTAELQFPCEFYRNSPEIHWPFATLVVVNDPITHNSSPPHLWIWFPLVIAPLEHPSRSLYTVTCLHRYTHTHTLLLIMTVTVPSQHLSHFYISCKDQWDSGASEVPTAQSDEHQTGQGCSLIRPPTNQLLPVLAEGTGLFRPDCPLIQLQLSIIHTSRGRFLLSDRSVIGLQIMTRPLTLDWAWQHLVSTCTTSLSLPGWMWIRVVVQTSQTGAAEWVRYMARLGFIPSADHSSWN